MKNYAILGISYCGSTLLSLLLGKAERVFSVGEAHWLVQGQPQCYICSGDCSFYSKDFLEEVSWSNLTTQITKRAKAKYGCDIVLYSDKNEKFYRQLFNRDKPDVFLLLFKSPKAFVTSYLKHSSTSSARQRKANIRKAIRQYEVGYLLNLKYAKETGSKVIKIYYDDLIQRMPEQIKMICSQLNIEYSKNLTNLQKLPEKLHQIGGNFRVSSDFLHKPIKLDDSWKDYLTKKEIKMIDDSVANEIFIEKLYCNK